MKKVMLFTHEYPPATGGAGVVAQDLNNALQSYNNIDLFVITKYRKGNFRNDENIINVRTLKKLHFLFYWNKIKKLGINDIDKIILNDIGACLTASLFFTKELQEKCIIFLHGSEPEKIFDKPSIPNKLIDFKKKYMTLLNNCHKIVAVSQFMKEKFIKNPILFKMKDKIVVIPNFVDSSVFNRKSIDLYKKFNIDKEKKLLLTVSRIVKGKGYLEKYGIFKKVIKYGASFHWIIVGDGPYLEEFKKIVENDGYSDKITFTGKVKRENLKEYYSSVHLFWLLSNFEEAMGLVYLESIVCGTQVIAYNRAGPKEIIKNGREGYLVENTKECQAILKEVDEGKIKLKTINESNKNLKESSIKKLVELIL